MTDTAGRVLLMIAVLGLVADAIWVNRENFRLKNMLMGKFDLNAPMIGTSAPDFRATSLDGKSFELRGARGSSVTVIYFSPDCGECERQVPLWNCLRDASAASGGLTFGMSSADPVQVRAFQSAHRLSFPCLIDSAGGFVKKYGVSGTPTIIRIGADGKIAGIIEGGE